MDARHSTIVTGKIYDSIIILTKIKVISMQKPGLAVLSIFFLIFILVTASCNKMEHQVNVASNETTSALKEPSQWKSLNWSSSPQEKFTIHYSTISDNSITPAIADKGLVLVYKKTANAINALPLDETETARQHWYYQVSPGSILIHCDAYGTDQALHEPNSFQYFIISEEKLKELEANEKSKIDLMELSYEQVSQLLN